MNEHDRALIASLTEHPGWQALKQASKERNEIVFRNLATKLMSGAHRLDMDAIAKDVLYARGVIAGMRLLLHQPDLTATEIEKELAKAKEEQDGESQQ
jgi:hypothetical protein